MKERSQLMSNIILETKNDGTRSTTWAERVDTVADYPYPDQEFAETKYTDPQDAALVLAENNAQINQVWAVCFSKMVSEANRLAGIAGMRLTASIVEGWVKDSDTVMDDAKSSEDSIITIDSVSESVADMQVSPPTTDTAPAAGTVEATFGTPAGGNNAPEVGIGAGIARWNQALFGPMPAPPVNIDDVNDGNANANANEPGVAADNDDAVPDRVVAGPVVEAAVEEVGEMDADEVDALARRHSDEVLAAVRADGVELHAVDANRLTLFSNLVFRLDRYRATGRHDQVLIDQITLG